jgi:hypothetical protein
MKAFTRFILCAALFLSFGCEPKETVSIPVIPKWQAPADASTKTQDWVFDELQKLDKHLPARFDDATFTLVNYDHAVAMVKWSQQFIFAANIKYTSQSHDCDKFAKMLVYAISLSAGYAGVEATPMAAVLAVVQVKAWGGVPGSGQGHAVVGVATDRGILIVEPQTGYYGMLKDYPNPIMEARVGG